MPSLVQKCVFYRPKLTGKWEQQEIEIQIFDMQKCIISTDRAQREDEKNGVVRLVTFTPRVMVIKMSKMAHYMYLLLNTIKITLGKIFNCN